LSKFISEKCERKEKEHQQLNGFRKQYAENDIDFGKGDLMAFFKKVSKMKYTISRLEATEAIMKSVDPTFNFSHKSTKAQNTSKGNATFTISVVSVPMHKLRREELIEWV
jgi:hypothetical protein